MSLWLQAVFPSVFMAAAVFKAAAVRTANKVRLTALLS